MRGMAKAHPSAPTQLRKPLDPLRSKRPDVDWTDVENRYRTGVESLRAIGADYKISEAAIRQRAAKEGWERDLTARVAVATKAKLLRRETSQRASHAKETEAKAVEIAATTRANLILTQRKDIAALRYQFATMLRELNTVGATSQEILAIAEELTKPGGKDKTAVLQRAKTAIASLVGVHERIESATRLTGMLERLIKLERAAFGMAEDAGGDDDPARGGGSLSLELDLHQRAAKIASIMDRARRAQALADGGKA